MKAYALRSKITKNWYQKTRGLPRLYALLSSARRQITNCNEDLEIVEFEIKETGNILPRYKHQEHQEDIDDA